MEQTRQLVETITKGIQEKKGQRIVIADLNGIDGSIANYFVICQARLEMQEKPTAVVGLGHSHWVAMDYGNVLVHIFLPETRSFYDLENLWEDAILTEVPDID